LETLPSLELAQLWLGPALPHTQSVPYFVFTSLNMPNKVEKDHITVVKQIDIPTNGGLSNRSGKGKRSELFLVYSQGR
jgi:hypothetical protein